MLFALEHAVGRHEKGQRNVTVAGGKTEHLKSPNGSQTPMFPANELFSAFELRNKRWKSGNFDFTSRLHPRIFSHEWLSFGEARDPERAIAHPKLEALAANGLLWLIPEL